jgi:hypothetical protein
VNLNLGINLGWLQQAANSGGRQIAEMTADLERVRGSAAAVGYTGYDPLIDTARGKLTSSQLPSSAFDQISDLIRLFQAQARGIDADALSLGIVLGWLQQGARANNRLISLATADLESARNHAANSQYNSYNDYIDQALAKLLSGQPIKSISVEIEILIRLFQGQG